MTKQEHKKKKARLDYDAYKQWYELTLKSKFLLPYQETCLVDDTNIMEIDGEILVETKFIGNNAYVPFQFITIEST